MLRWFLEEESGQGMVEYALLLGLVAIAAVGLVGVLGDSVKAKFEEVVNKWPNV